jgi:hypothetical protein
MFWLGTGIIGDVAKQGVTMLAHQIGSKGVCNRRARLRLGRPRSARGPTMTEQMRLNLTLEVSMPSSLAQNCQRCAGEPVPSVRALMKAMLHSNAPKLYSTGDILREFTKTGLGCAYCTPVNIISMQMYHLRQDGGAEAAARGRFRKRESDASSPDFVYAGRPTI